MSLRTRALEAREIHQLIKNGTCTEDHLQFVLNTQRVKDYIDICECDFQLYLIVYDKPYFVNERETCQQIKEYLEKWNGPRTHWMQQPSL